MRKYIIHICFILIHFAPFYSIAQRNLVIDSLQNTLQTAQEDTNKIKALAQLSLNYWKVNPQEGIAYGNEAISLSGKLNWGKGLALADLSIGINYCLGTADYTKAIEHLNHALLTFEQLGMKKEMSITFNNLAVSFQNQGHFNKALSYYHQTLGIEEDLGNKKATATTLANIGSLYREISNFPQAMDYYHKALKISKDNGDKTAVAQVLASIGNVYFEEHKYELAYDYSSQALKLNEELGNKRSMAYNLMSIAAIFTNQPDSASVRMGLSPDDRFTRLLEFTSKAMTLFRELKHQTGMANIYSNLGITYYNIADNNDSALILSQFNGDRSAVINLARCYIDSALAIHTNIKDLTDMMHDYEILCEIQTLSGYDQDALESHKKYVEIKDSVFNLENERKLTERTMQYEFDKKEALHQQEEQIKDQKIALINRENEIKSLQLIKQETVLRNSRLEAEKNQAYILLLNTNNEVQQLTLIKTQKELAQRQAEAKAKAAELELTQKDKQLKEQQLEQQTLLRNGILAGAALLMAVALLAFRSIQLKRKLERQQAISQERKRISADLHDDIGSGLSKISLLSEMLKKETGSGEAKSEAIKISETAHALSDNISEIIWALNTNNDYLENLIAYIRRYAGEYFEHIPVDLNINVQESIPSVAIGGEVRRNIFYTVKEALHNIVKHSNATKAEVTFTVNNNRLTIIISDNGKGIPEGELNRFGNGLNNMKNRMKSVHGEFAVTNHYGTTVTIALPL